MTNGAWRTGKLTDRAMKQCACASCVDLRDDGLRRHPRAPSSCGMQGHLDELTGPGRLHAHRPGGPVGVADDDDARARRHVQRPQHVALAQRGDEQVLGRVPGGVAAERGVGGAEQGRLALDHHLVVAAVGGVARRALRAGAGPGHAHVEAVQAAHARHGSAGRDVGGANYSDRHGGSAQLPAEAGRDPHPAGRVPVPGRARPRGLRRQGESRSVSDCPTTSPTSARCTRGRGRW